LKPVSAILPYPGPGKSGSSVSRTGKNGELGYASGYWLFELGNLGGLLREMEDDYGVLPMPKYDENQRRYYHDASLGNSPVAAIPISASEGGATASFILEAMSYESYDRVLPVFYDNYLTTKLVRDEESVEMLRIIHDTLYYDIGALFNWGNLRIMIEDCCAAKNPPVSQFAKSRQRIQNFMEKTLEKINA